MYQIEWLAIGDNQIPAQFLFHLAPSDQWYPITSFAILLTGPNGRHHVIDTGVRSPKEINDRLPPMRHWKVDPSHSLERQLMDRGISLSDIDSVLLTHLHYDHCSQISIFPRADIIVSRAEWTSVVAPYDTELLRFAYYPRDIYAWIVRDGWDRVQLIDDGDEILPGIQAWVLGGHTPGSTAYRVKTSKGFVMIAGDFINTYKNWEEHHPPGLLVSLAEWYAGYHRLAKSGSLIIPSHDPTLSARYPTGTIV
jgi:glyoxylase-like metal-dependent hydrolase (beta-lactamase superfamily II)